MTISKIYIGCANLDIGATFIIHDGGVRTIYDGFTSMPKPLVKNRLVYMFKIVTDNVIEFWMEKEEQA